MSEATMAMMTSGGQNSAYEDDEARWQAVLERDTAADGAFYYGVRSTGVYCRPTCPSRRPRRDRVAFFDAPDAAERVGFRPCRRCRPNEVSAHQQVVAQAQRLLEEADRPPSLAELGNAVGMSPFHLQRIFKRATGLSPREYAVARRTERLKGALRRGVGVTEALYDAGYASSRALYESAQEQLGMSPGRYQKGGKDERIAYALAESPLGRMLVAATEKGVCALRLGDDDATLEQELRAEFPQAALVRDDEVVAPYVHAAAEHLEGYAPRLDLPVDVRASAFQQRVWAALRDIPYGQTRSYSQVAQMIGEPSAVRAVARACATNPVALVVPCHRVVRTGGALGGYRWGLARKRALLERERRQVTGKAVPGQAAPASEQPARQASLAI